MQKPDIWADSHFEMLHHHSGCLLYIVHHYAWQSVIPAIVDIAISFVIIFEKNE